MAPWPGRKIGVEARSFIQKCKGRFQCKCSNWIGHEIQAISIYRALLHLLVFEVTITYNCKRCYGLPLASGAGTAGAAGIETGACLGTLYRAKGGI